MACNERGPLQCVSIIYEEDKELPEGIARFARLQRRMEAVDEIKRIVESLLREEERRHAPYVELRNALINFEDAAEPSHETSPIVVEMPTK